MAELARSAARNQNRRLRFAKGFRFLLTMVLSCLFLFFLTKSAIRYNKGLTAMSLKYVKPQFYAFPNLHICGRFLERGYYDAQSVVNRADHFISFNETHSEWVQVRGYGKESDLAKLGLNESSNIWEHYDLDSLDFCALYRPNGRFRTTFGSNPVFKVSLETIRINSYLLSISHQDNTNWVSLGDTRHQLIAEYGRAVEATVQLGVTKQLPTEEFPCQTGEKVTGRPTYGQCINSYITKTAGCPLPDEKCWKEKNVNGPQVNSLIQELKKMSHTELLALTGCRQTCKLHNYDLMMGPTTRREDVKDVVDITIKHQDVPMTMREEYVVYDGYAFFADMGGQVGILLGLSILSVFDEVIKTLAKLGGKYLD